MEISEAELDSIMRLDLMTFVDRTFAELEPQRTLSAAPYLQILSTKLQETLTGKGPKRLIINLPPRSLKSITVSIGAVAWLLGHDPTKHIICASYGQDLSDKLARDTLKLMQSSFYRRVFPLTVLERSAVSDFSTTQGGGRMATSVGGVITGRGADIIILDDPLKPDEGLSETRRAACNDWFDNTLLSRLNDKENGIIVIVMQRIHQDDLVGHVQERGEPWEVLSFPALAEEDEVFTVETAFGEYTYTRKMGDPLDPERESSARLQSIKESMGTYNFSSQYQQNPVPPGGAMVLKEWLRFYAPEGPLPRFTTTLQSWDTANKSGELNDYSVCTTWGVYDGKYYLLDVFRARLNYPDLKRKAIELSKKHEPRTILIEDKASGTQLIQELKREGMVGVKPYSPPPQTDKIMRLHAQTARFEAGQIQLPQRAPWLEGFVLELTSFPGSRFDDQVDSTTQALDHLASHDLSVWERLGK